MQVIAFLKDYGYVKEYGEGVDRMCRELEAIGLPDPRFNNDTFILKTTVRSADWERQRTQNARIHDQNARVDDQNARIGDKNARIEPESSWESAKTVWIEHVLKQKNAGQLSAITADAIITVIADLRENQIISTADIQKILDCKETKALRIMNEMKNKGIIRVVSGKGKGRYILKVAD